MSDKTKAAMPGRQWYTSKRIENDISIVIDQVNGCSLAHISFNYGKFPGVTAAMARSLLAGGMRHCRSTQSPNFSGDLQSAENSADTSSARKLEKSRFPYELLSIEIFFEYLRENAFYIGQVFSNSFFAKLSLLINFSNTEKNNQFIISINKNIGLIWIHINEFNIVAREILLYLTENFFLVDSHSKLPATLQPTNEKLYVANYIIDIKGIFSVFSNCKNSQKNFTKLRAVITTAVTQMMIIHLLDISAPLLSRSDNQLPGLINLAQTSCSRNKSLLLLPQVAGLLWEKNTQRHRETTVTTIKATIIFLRIGNQPCGSSFAFLRKRLLISPSIAVVMNCPVLSFGNFTLFIPSITSCAIRAVTDCDLEFFGPVAMSTSYKVWCKTIYTFLISLKALTCKTPCIYGVSYTSRYVKCENNEAPQVLGTPAGPLTKPLIGVTVMADMQSTQTHPKFTWRFLALSVTESSIVRITAATEREARDQSPAGCVMVFASRLPLQEARHA